MADVVSSNISFKTIVDLRAADLRWRLPCAGARFVAFEVIENGRHGLQPEDGPILVICSRGPRAMLAARFLQADGISASGKAFSGVSSQ